ncbi:LysM peptidoglycan-binding domain-containing protein [uncultured Roseobacter sp.]|uniref:LysM peptidoglycan-binding domain-containing protein n=1 Tax=uncultured Roseobacter sp. TaxID=114847 RepID=UPI00262D9E93|nr:LysM peptidoglycan-binding domain-containing protein [uncultured Roseobacter sp.]
MQDEGTEVGSGGPRRWLAGVVVIGALAAGLFLTTSRETGPSGEEPVATVVPEASAPGEAAVPAPVAEAPVTEEPAPAEVAQAPETVAPTVDEVRLESDGIAVIAGRAEPGAEVSVRVDGEEVATAVADSGGAFAAVGVVAPSDAARVLTLEAQGSGEAVISEEDVILAPMAPQVAEVEPAPQESPAETVRQDGEAVAAAEPAAEDAPDQVARAADAPADAGDQIATAPTDAPGAAEPAGEVDQSAAGTAPEPVDEAPQSAATAETEPASATPEVAGVAEADPAEAAPEVAGVAEADPAEAAPEPGASQSVAVLKSTAEGVELLQAAPEVMTSVAIDTIGYSDAGDVQLSGRAVAGTSEVRVYLNNRFVAALPVDPEGAWRGSIPEIDAGLYQLRVDEVNVIGNVTSRIETPFKREAPAVLSEADAAGAGPVRAVTVQTGDTLWAIARDRYGEGVLYVKVFEANRRDIRDPDLIYPGQVFDLPVE